MKNLIKVLIILTFTLFKFTDYSTPKLRKEFDNVVITMSNQKKRKGNKCYER